MWFSYYQTTYLIGDYKGDVLMINKATSGYRALYITSTHDSKITQAICFPSLSLPALAEAKESLHVRVLTLRGWNFRF